MTPEGWTVEENPRRLVKVFRFPNFREALAFAQRVGELAEAHNHHPRLTVEWGRVTVEWWTHSAGGITERDEAMAQRTDQVVR